MIQKTCQKHHSAKLVGHFRRRKHKNSTSLNEFISLDWVFFFFFLPGASSHSKEGMLMPANELYQNIVFAICAYTLIYF